MTTQYSKKNFLIFHLKGTPKMIVFAHKGICHECQYINFKIILFLIFFPENIAPAKELTKSPNHNDQTPNPKPKSCFVFNFFENIDPPIR